MIGLLRTISRHAVSCLVMADTGQVTSGQEKVRSGRSTHVRVRSGKGHVKSDQGKVR